MFPEKLDVVTQEKYKWCASYLLDFGGMLNRTPNDANYFHRFYK